MVEAMLDLAKRYENERRSRSAIIEAIESDIDQLMKREVEVLDSLMRDDAERALARVLRVMGLLNGLLAATASLLDRLARRLKRLMNDARRIAHSHGAEEIVFGIGGWPPAISTEFTFDAFLQCPGEPVERH